MNIKNQVIHTEWERIENQILEDGKRRYEIDINNFFHKRNLGIGDYIEQLEKNNPYNNLLYGFNNSMIVNYFQNYSDRSGKEVYESLARNAQKEASEHTPAIVEYLKTGVGGDNPFCKDYVSLRNMSTKNPKDYVEELEFCLTCYKSRYIVSHEFLFIISSPNYEEFRKYFAQNLTADQTFDLIEARFKILGNKIIGNHKPVLYMLKET